MPEQIQIGSLQLNIGKLTLGQLRRNDELLEAVNRLQQLSPSQMGSGRMPSAEQFNTMVTIVAAAASAHTPGITADTIANALDDEPYDVGFITLAQCVAIATYGRKIKGGKRQGEAESPSSSISADSTGSSPQLSDIALQTSTS